MNDSRQYFNVNQYWLENYLCIFLRIVKGADASNISSQC
jgi:hypothetical protein